MSGGYAFVYKLRKERLNHEATTTEELLLMAVTGDLAQELRQLIERHKAETGSQVAERILSDFDSELANFTVVMPADFASVTEIRDRARAEGVDPDSDGIWKQILEATNG
jgi:glutamate synthase (NADPH/NADH) large chain